MVVVPSTRLKFERESARLTRKEGDPAIRRLRIFAVDPTVRHDLGGVATLTIPYETLKDEGLKGTLFKVSTFDDEDKKFRAKAKLDEPEALIEHGYTPSMSRDEFAGQMLYAVAMSLYGQFVSAFGRELPLGLHGQGDVWSGGQGLTLKPFAFSDVQAQFVPGDATVEFGYHPAHEAAPGFSPEAKVYSCHSHDIVVHELAHAFLHAARPNLMYPLNADVLALHEGFADLIAIFQRLRYDDFVLSSIAASGANVEEWGWLHNLAGNYSSSAGKGHTLRDVSGFARLQDEKSEAPHDRGLILVQAVFEAFRNILKDRIDEVVLLATYGSGVLPRGRIAPVLAQKLASETQKVAGHLQSMLIRAFDYLPPIGPLFGDYLRAIITADTIIVPSDTRRYRMYLIDAFRRRGIFPTNHDGRSRKLHMTEDGLMLDRFGHGDPDDANSLSGEGIVLKTLSFGAAGFSGDPSAPAHKDAGKHADRVAKELTKEIFGSTRKAKLLKQVLSLEGDEEVLLQSLRPYRRLSPGRDALVGTVIELGWSRAKASPGEPADVLDLNGALILTDNEGRIEYVICHRDLNVRRSSEKAFQQSAVGSGYWMDDDGTTVPRENTFGLLCSSD